jgi:hypothetical protein
MRYSRIPPAPSRLASIGLAYGFCYIVFLGLVIISESGIIGGIGHGWEVMSWCLAVMAVSLVVAGFSLLTWIMLRYRLPTSKKEVPGKLNQHDGVWDQQLDG